MLAKLLSTFNILATARDAALALLLFLTVMLMIMPMPTVIVDMLIGFNFAVAILLLMTSIYLKHALDLSSLPGIILVSTIFRLALSVTTTRLILAQGDAGAIIVTFGQFVIAGNVVVGLVVFFIVTIVQFMVISKGAERIAEVAARFTLDAMPGKQMSIDAEMRNGDIDAEEAGRRRKLLQRESQLYGAMDGAMKFVKGDSIAGLIIIFVNLVGGITIGVVQRGMTAQDAIGQYALLSIGDALISQLPALMISLAAASIVTRVPGKAQVNLGADIIGQLGAEPRALGLAAVALMALGLIPGFPTAILGLLAAIFGAATFLTWNRAGQTGSADGATEKSEEQGAKDTGAQASPPSEEEAEPTPIRLQVSQKLADELNAKTLGPGLETARSNVKNQLGVSCPAASVETVPDMADDMVRVMFDDVPILSDCIMSKHLIVEADAELLEACEIPDEDKRQMPRAFGNATFVDARHMQLLEDAELSFDTPATAALALLDEALMGHIGHFIGIQETQELLTECEQSLGALLQEVMNTLSLQQIADVLRRLLRDRISIANRRMLLEALAEWGGGNRTSEDVTEFVRLAFRRQVCDRVADANRMISGIIVEDGTEALMRDRLHQTVIGTSLSFAEDECEELLSKLRRVIDKKSPDRGQLVIFVAVDLRRHLRAFLLQRRITVEVISSQELVPGYTFFPVSTLRLSRQRSAA
ncbi:type III secretion system export apparatus subunit SctV [Thalassococcus sp. S3]|uniref:type III secretion system export apparatus subunit SctV n=1 Tax=Thalassococcus sp. S3 TaxID=2017482 RepID=UPI00102441B4|nr:type III secretion system export apparatus subunit SctV [Thalassococcus sp. S3]QBF33392.1 EscV/YscV/HrcV family type III secretion system export apparatus protein [Thalassococcus sp. S3]